MTNALGTTAEVAIVDDVIEALEQIKSGGGQFNTDVTTIMRMLGNVMEVPQRPAILVTPMASPRSHACPNGLRRIDLGLVITCVIDVFQSAGSLGRDFKDTEKVIREFAADVEKAVTADITRGGRAIDTTIVSVDIYEIHESMPVAAAEVTLTIPFRHLTQDPTTAQ